MDIYTCGNHTSSPKRQFHPESETCVTIFMRCAMGDVTGDSPALINCQARDRDPAWKAARE